MSNPGGWFYLHIVDGVDPSLEDADFMSTWFKQGLGAYAGEGYDGPPFTGSAPGTLPLWRSW